MKVVFAVSVLLVTAGLARGDEAAGSNASAQVRVPALVSYGAALKDGAGKPLSGPQALTFSLYADQESRTPLWQETQSIQADEQGRYSVNLGAASASGMPLELFTSGRSLWLGVQPAAGAEQIRVLLVSVPYALKAGDADTLGGIPASAYLTRQSAGGSTPGGEALASVATANSRAAITAASTVNGTGTANYLSRWTDSATLGNSLLFQAGYNVGLGTTSPLARLHLNTVATTGKGLIVQGMASQTGNLQEWQDSSATVLGYVNKSGGALFPTAGIGNIAPQPGSVLYVRQDFGNPTATSLAGMTVSPSMTPTDENTTFLYGANMAAYINGYTGTRGQVFGALIQANSQVAAGGLVDTMVGGRFRANNLSNGAINNLYGGQFTAYNTGGATVGNMGAGYFYNQISSSALVTNLYGALIATPSISSSTVVNNYGLYLQPIAGGTHNYSIYSAGGTSYFAGNVGIGTNAPSANLEVNGTTKFNGLVTFASGQTFPGGGGGTITGVTAGTDLTGGGTSGNVTVNLDTTKVPQLSTPNTFATDQTILGNLYLPTTTTSTGGLYVGGLPAILMPGNSNYFLAAAGNLAATGGDNLGVGQAALYSLGSGRGNTALGSFTLEHLGSGGGNTAMGDSTMYWATTANSNTAAGTGSLYYLTSGNGNSAYGMYAGNTIHTGNYNTFLGFEADATADLTNATAIGYLAKVSANDALVLGGTYTDDSNVVHYTNVGIGTSAPNRPLTIQGTGLSSELISLADNTGATKYHLNYYGGGLNFTETAVADGRLFLKPGGTVGINTSTPSSSYALDVNGNVHVSGTLYAGAKNFRIDDPLDPVHKDLYHASIESSEMKNLYDGVVTLDNHGRATVKLPEWFEPLNQDFRYQLTAIGRGAPGIYVAHEISNGKFTIAGGKPLMKVSWQVTGIRHDEWAKQHPLVVEEPKVSTGR